MIPSRYNSPVFLFSIYIACRKGLRYLGVSVLNKVQSKTGNAKMKKLVEFIKAHALRNYDSGGWYVVAECWDDARIAQQLTEAGATTQRAALAAFKTLVSIWSEQQSPQFAPHWRREFGASYCVPTLPGWTDDSWRNDVCPRFINKANPNLELWVDHPDPAQRETGNETPRFRVAADNELYTTDELRAALAFVSAYLEK